MPSNQRERSLPLYLLLANALTWLGWIPAILISRSRGLMLPMMDNLGALVRDGFVDGTHVAISMLFHLAVYGPLVAAIVTIACAEGRPGLASLWESMTRFRLGYRWYEGLPLLTLALAAVPFAIGALAGLPPGTLGDLGTRLAWIVPILLYQLVTSGLEEPGWRGTMMPLLTERLGRDRAIWIGGLWWAVWHYPVTILITLGQLTGELAAAQVVITLIMALAGQTMSLIGMTYLYAWIMRRTESVWAAILFHAWSNTMVWVFGGNANPIMNLAIAAMPWAAVVVMEKALGKERFP